MRDSLGRVESVVLLGGTSDLGLAIARRVLRGRGGRLVLAGRHEIDLRRSAAAFQQSSLSVETRAFDALEPSEHAKLIEDLFDGEPDVDLVIFAFGVLGDQVTAEYDAEEAIRIAGTNYLGTVAAMTTVAHRMREQGHGTIVLLSSVAGERVRRSNYVYGSSKAGADSFAQGLSCSLAGSGVSVLIARLGFVRTKMTEGMKAPPLSTTTDRAAAQVARALERGDEIIWVPSGLRWVMSLLRHLPRAVFARLPI